MNRIYQKIPLIAELFINGIFIVVYSLDLVGKMPATIPSGYVDVFYQLFQGIVPFVIVMSILTNFFLCESLEEFFRKYVFSIIVLIPLVITHGDIEFCYWLSSAHLLSSLLTLYESDIPNYQRNSLGETLTPIQHFFRQIKLSPAQIITLSFLGVIIIGAFLLMIPIASTSGDSLNFWDALFIATSATCVTGLSTISIGTELSIFGQMIVLILIQIGGLGIMTLSSSMMILIGKSLGMKDRIIRQDLLGVSSLEDIYAMISDIIRYTLIIELWGALVLTFAFVYDGFDLTTSLYYGFFHSISAFCNAGFALFDNSLESYATNPLVHGTISILIVLGGLGFIVLKELKSMIASGTTLVRMSLHTKIVILTTLFLTVFGFCFIFFGEYLNALDSYSLWEKVQISLFQSITLRTAGFNTLEMTSLNAFTIYGMTLFMFIGASPGSTGGGIKTTTFAILLQSIRSTLFGKKDLEFFDRKIPSQVIVRATAITFISIIISSLFILILMKIEPEQSFLPLFFEVISASGTVGLSLGVTPFLSVAGKIGLSLLMLIGRIGPLTLVLAIGEQKKLGGKIDYPDGKILIG